MAEEHARSLKEISDEAKTAWSAGDFQLAARLAAEARHNVSIADPSSRVEQLDGGGLALITPKSDGSELRTEIA